MFSAGYLNVRHRDFMRTLLLVLLASTLAAQGAPLGGATGRIDEDLGQVIGFTKSFSLTRDICNENFPDLSARTSVAVEEWEKRNATTIYEMNDRWQAFLEDLSGGDKDKRLAAMAHFENESKQNEAVVRRMFSKLPAGRLRSVCMELPTSLAPGVRELEDVMKYQLEIVRRPRPGVSK